MAIDIRNEHLLTLRQAAGSLPMAVAPSTAWRWCRKGVRGIRLESVVIGGKRVTSAEAIQRFAEALTAAAEQPGQDEIGADSSPVRDESAQRRLKAAGLLE